MQKNHALFWIKIGIVMAALSVVLGAFGAHGLDQTLMTNYKGQTRVVGGEEMPASLKYLNDFKTAAEYQMYHALGLIAVGLLGLHTGASPSLNWAGRCFVGGILLFSGSLYLLVISGVRVLGAITPFGGMLFIFGWIIFGLATMKLQTVNTTD
ncbi:DUF423 domain-containing protein [Planctomicrobium sp. SH668]|uniref:DUF423 domain-containing protein n=1 Tax=Planctomicrobium sp. SH668 TaxID=3448126 RepID=UPI003F5BF179